MTDKKVYRSADDGRFITEKKANRTDPKTWVKETIKSPPKTGKK